MSNFLDKTGLSYFWEKIKEYVDGKSPIYTAITLSASSWVSANIDFNPDEVTGTPITPGNSQTVTVQGVLADETEQLILPMPATASQSAYYAAGILCTAQAENSLTFSCQTVPTEDITVYITIQEVTPG